MLVRRVRLRDLLGRHELQPDDHERRCQEEEGEADRRAEQRSLRGQRVAERVDQDEAERGKRREPEQSERAELRHRIRRQRRHDARLVRLRPSATASTDQKDERGDDRVPQAAHALNLRPSSRHKASSAGIARNHVTSPSGTGPM
jgi:hypothetical protein